MIIKGSTHTSRGLAAHLLDRDSGNELVELLPGRGVSVETDGDLRQAIRELAARGQAHAHTRRPLLHISLSPDPGARPMRPDDWELAWRNLEREFGLQEQPHAALRHRKNARDHHHRAYLGVDEGAGRCIDMRRNYARQELAARLTEWELDHPLIRGRHNAWVCAELRRRGVGDVADALDWATQIDRPVSRTTWLEHQQGLRTGVDARSVQDRIAAAWASADSGRALEAALAADGLALAHGDRAYVVVDATGGAHPLLRGLNRARAKGRRVLKAELNALVGELELPTVHQVREAQSERAAAATQGETPDDPRPRRTAHAGPPPRRAATSLEARGLRELRECGMATLAGGTIDTEGPGQPADLLPGGTRAPRSPAARVQRPRAAGQSAELSALARERELHALERRRDHVSAAARELRSRLARCERVLSTRHLQTHWHGYEPVRSQLAAQLDGLDPLAQRANELRSRWGWLAWLSPAYHRGRRAAGEAERVQDRIEEHFEAAARWADRQRGKVRSIEAQLAVRRTRAARALLSLDTRISELAEQLGVTPAHQRQRARDSELANAEALYHLQEQLAREHRPGPAATLERLREQAREDSERGRGQGHAHATSGRGAAPNRLPHEVDFDR